MSINVVVLVGNAGRDPELRFFESGSCVCEFTLAINRPPRDGQNQEPLWVSCKAWGKTAQVAGDYVRKGSKVAIVGRLEIEQWTDRSSGEVRSKALVVIDRLELCGRHQPRRLAGAVFWLAAATAHRRWRLGRGLEHHPGRRNAPGRGAQRHSSPQAPAVAGAAGRHRSGPSPWRVPPEAMDRSR